MMGWNTPRYNVGVWNEVVEAYDNVCTTISRRNVRSLVRAFPDKLWRVKSTDVGWEIEGDTTTIIRRLADGSSH